VTAQFGLYAGAVIGQEHGEELADTAGELLTSLLNR
jgi:hypothetical protein